MTDIPRLTDAELDDVKAKHGKFYADCNVCRAAWPCETVRLATEVRELRVVAKAAKQWHYDVGGTPDLPDDTELYRALARYEEGGR